MISITDIQIQNKIISENSDTNNIVVQPWCNLFTEDESKYPVISIDLDTLNTTESRDIQLNRICGPILVETITSNLPEYKPQAEAFLRLLGSISSVDITNENDLVPTLELLPVVVTELPVTTEPNINFIV